MSEVIRVPDNHQPRQLTVERQIRREADRMADSYPELAKVICDWLNFAEPALIAERLPTLLADLRAIR